MRRGAAWPAERPGSRLVVREHTHGWAAQRVVARVVAKEVRMPAVLSSPCPRSCLVSGVRCPVSGAGVRCSTGCPVRASERLGVHCPASSVRRPVSVRCGVRCVQREWGRGRGVGRQPHGWDGPGSAWSPAVSTTARRLPEVGAWPSKLAQAVLGQRTIDLDLVVVGGGWQWGHVDRVADQDRLDAREHRPSVGSWRRPRCVVNVGPRGGRVAWSLEGFPAEL